MLLARAGFMWGRGKTNWMGWGDEGGADLAGEGDCLLLTDIRKEGETPAGFSPTRMLRRTEVLRPWQAKVLQITRVASAEAVKAPERPVSPSDAERAAAEAWAAQKGVEWKLSIPGVQSAPRDMAQVVFGLKPGQGLPTASASASFLGSNVRSDLNPDPENPGWLKCAVPIEVPAETYKGMKEAVTVPSMNAVLVCKKDLPEELVYQMTKVLFENKDELVNDKKTYISAEYAVSGIPVPFHPGAEKYFKEIGLLK